MRVKMAIDPTLQQPGEPEGAGEEQHHGPKSFPVVGVGASAGGLEAFSSLIDHLPADIGMAFLLVQHLDPEHKSLLTEILSRKTRLPVAEAREGMEVEPNHIYVIPPNNDMSISGEGSIPESRTEIRGHHLPVDLLFESLAEDQGSNAIGLILSGTGSDGATGIQKIKAEGGITFAQDAASTRYNGMPQSAISTGCVDFVLPPQEIARELQRISRHPYIRPAKTEVPPEEGILKKVFRMLLGFLCG